MGRRALVNALGIEPLAVWGAHVAHGGDVRRAVA
jgi:hypothetical protein